MSELKINKKNDFLNLRLLNNSLNQSEGLNFFKKLGYYLFNDINDFFYNNIFSYISIINKKKNTTNVK